VEPAEGDTRIVPIHPELTRLLRAHLASFDPAADSRLFTGVRGRELPTITHRRAWVKARQVALTSAEQASPLARRPYDLRHACLPTWLNGGVYPAQVAEWEVTASGRTQPPIATNPRSRELGISAGQRP
jgi:integrase